jgi:hypothetical protein
MPTIGQFVEELAKGGDWSKQFERFPRRTMKKFGLTGTQIKKIMRGSIDSLRKEIDDDLKPKKALVFRVKRG